MKVSAGSIQSALEAYRLGDPLLSKRRFARVLESIEALDRADADSALDMLMMAAETDLVAGDFEAGRECIRLAYAVAARAAPQARRVHKLNITTQHLQLALAEGDLELAVALCDRVAKPFERSVIDRCVAAPYGLEVVQLLRVLGLVGPALNLVGHMEREWLPAEPGRRVEIRASLLQLRVSLVAQCCGRSVNTFGPHGWHPLPRIDQPRALEAALRAQAREIPVALSLGKAAHAELARLNLELYSANAPLPDEQLVVRLQARADRLQELGFARSRWRSVLDLASAQFRLGQWAAASANLESLRDAAPLQTRRHPHGEEWQWQRHRIMKATGNMQAALEAYEHYAALVDERRQHAAALMAQVGTCAALAELAADPPDPGHEAEVPIGAAEARQEREAFEARLRSLGEGAASVTELAAILGVTTRRLQQMFTHHQLGTPREYLRRRAPDARTRADGPR